MFRLFARALSAGFIAIAAGCGGSGGGGHDTTETPMFSGEPVTYTGSTSPALISENRAFGAAQMFTDALEKSQGALSLWIDIPHNYRAGSSTTTGSQGGLMLTQLEESGASIIVRVEFKNFAEDGATYNGYFEQTVPLMTSSSPSLVSSDTGLLTIKRISISENGSSISISGTVTRDGAASTTDLIARDDDTGKSQQLKAFRVATEYPVSNPTNPSGSSPRTTISGSVYDSEKGLLNITTIKPILDLAYDETADSWRGRGNGTILLSGNNSSLQFKALNQRFISLLLDEDKNGEYERAVRASWETLSDESGFGPKANSNFPVANTGEQLLANLKQPTTLSALFSHDDDNDFLTFQWVLEHKPTASQLKLTNASQPVVTFLPDVLGDYIFTVYVSDGIHQSKSSIKISPFDADVTVTSEATVGALEVLPSPTNPDQYLFNADSAIADINDGTDFDNRTYSWDADLQTSVSIFLPLLNYIIPDFFGSISLQNYIDLSSAPAGTYRIYYPNSGADLNLNSIGHLDVNIGDVELDLTSQLKLVPKGTDEAGYDGIEFLDIDGDQQKDILTWGIDIDGVVYFAGFFQTPDKKFSASAATRMGASAVSTGDLNGDGKLDVANMSADGVYVSYQLSDRTFTAPVFLSNPVDCNEGHGIERRPVSIFDANGDGRPDLAAAICDKVALWKQTSTGTLTTPEILSTGITTNEFIDINKDGRMDVLGYINSGNGTAAIAINTITGYSTTTFSDASAVLAASDITNDNRIDLIVKTNGAPYEILEQTESGQFQHLANLIPDLDFYYASSPRFLFADVNGDGRTDVIESASGIFNTHANLGNGKFRSIFMDLPGSATRPIAVADLNEDGRDDVVAGDYSAGLSVYWNGLRVFSTPVLQ